MTMLLHFLGQRLTIINKNICQLVDNISMLIIKIEIKCFVKNVGFRGKFVIKFSKKFPIVFWKKILT